MKNKGERERYIQINSEFKRTAQRDKRTLFKEQCIKLEENNRRRKNRDLFVKTGNIKGEFWSQMSTIKDSKSRDLVDTGEIKKI